MLQSTSRGPGFRIFRFYIKMYVLVSLNNSRMRKRMENSLRYSEFPWKVLKFKWKTQRFGKVLSCKPVSKDDFGFWILDFVADLYPACFKSCQFSFISQAASSTNF